jgi:DNA-binding transcriptional ArsR family regulator
MEHYDAALMLAALGHEARLAAFRHLIAAGPDGVVAGSLAAALDIPPSTLSHHLSALDHAGLVSSRREGRHVIYAVVPETVRALIGFLRDDCCGGRPALCGLGDREAARP